MSIGSAFGASDNLIVQTFTAEDIGGGIIGFTGTVDMTYGASAGAGKLFAGDNFEIYWFPTITSLSGTIPAGVSYGAYTNTTADAGSGSDIGFVAPSDGNTYSLNAFDNVSNPDALSTATPTAFSANSTTSVPEPSSVVLLVAGGFLMTGALMRRRKVA